MVESNDGIRVSAWGAPLDPGVHKAVVGRETRGFRDRLKGFQLASVELEGAAAEAGAGMTREPFRRRAGLSVARMIGTCAKHARRSGRREEQAR